MFITEEGDGEEEEKEEEEEEEVEEEEGEEGEGGEGDEGDEPTGGDSGGGSGGASGGNVIADWVGTVSLIQSKYSWLPCRILVEITFINYNSITIPVLIQRNAIPSNFERIFLKKTYIHDHLVAVFRNYGLLIHQMNRNNN